MSSPTPKRCSSARNFDTDTDVIVSWLPCFHDMGMTGFLTVPMYFGAELVKVTPMDFLRDTLLWAKLIDKYKGTMTAAPNFAYNLFAKRLRRQATPGQFDLSSLRWALSGAEQVDPADVEDLCEAGARSVCDPRRSCPPTAWPRPRSRCRSPNAAAAWSSTRWTPTCWRSCTAPFRPPGQHRALVSLGQPMRRPGRPHRRRGRRRAARARRRRHPGARQAGDQRLHHDGRFHRRPGRQGWYDTGDMGYLTEAGDVVVCGRVKDVIIMAGRNIYPTDIERAAARVAGVRPGCAVAVRLDAGHVARELRRRSRIQGATTIPTRCAGSSAQVAHEVVADVDVRPRNVVVLEPGMIPKTPSGKLRRAHAMPLVV